MAGFASKGTLFKAGDGGGTEVFTAVAGITSVGVPKVMMETVEITSHDDAYKAFAPTIGELGEFTMEINFLPANATQSYATGLLHDLNQRTLRNFKVVFSDTATTTWTFSAFVTQFEPKVGGPTDKLAATITFRPSGPPTLA